MGEVHDEYAMSLIYNAADLYVAPSLEDNLPSTINESLHCGVPVVAFNIGGVPDMIEHKKNGYLAVFKDVEDLENGIIWCIKNLNKRVSIRDDYMKNEEIINALVSLYKQD